MSIISDPTDAGFTITDAHGKLVAEGVTPAIVQLDSFAGYFRWAKYDVIYTKADFQDKAVTLKSTISPFYFLNYPMGVGIGFLIDPFTGAMFDLPKELRGDFTTDLEVQ